MYYYLPFTVFKNQSGNDTDKIQLIIIKIIRKIYNDIKK